MYAILQITEVAKYKLWFLGHQISWVSEWVIEYAIDWVRDFSPWTSSAMEAMKEMKFGTKVA